jgi:polyisoprenoid-binding protein YceI
MKEFHMKLRNLLFTFVLSLLLAGIGLAADTYEIDPVHTSVGFSVKHLVISSVHGKFKDFTGTILFDDKDPSQCSVTGTIKAASITTDNADRDKHLQSPDFLDVEKFPTLTFKSTKVEKKGNDYQVTGTLTIHGVTKEVSFPATLSGPIKDPWGNMKLGVEFSLTIKRADYGLTWNKALESGGVLVGDDVKIDVSAEAAKK